MGQPHCCQDASGLLHPNPRLLAKPLDVRGGRHVGLVGNLEQMRATLEVLDVVPLGIIIKSLPRDLILQRSIIEPRSLDLFHLPLFLVENELKEVSFDYSSPAT